MRRLLLFVLACAAGCAGELSDPERFEGTFADAAAGACDQGLDVESDIFAMTCVGSVCHDATEPAGLLDLESSGAAARMIDVASTCDGKLLIDSANVDASYLLEKVGGAPQCGDPMPLAGTPLSAGRVACVREWIEESL